MVPKGRDEDALPAHLHAVCDSFDTSETYCHPWCRCGALTSSAIGLWLALFDVIELIRFQASYREEDQAVPRIAAESGAPIDRGLKRRMRGEERRISSQHRQLGDLFRHVRDSVARGGPRKAVGDFLLFATVLDAHMSVEEDIYFPALHGLRSDLANELEALVREHELIRAELSQIRIVLAKADRAAAFAAFDQLVDFLNRHEREEEELIARVIEGPLSGLGQSSLES